MSGFKQLERTASTYAVQLPVEVFFDGIKWPAGSWLVINELGLMAVWSELAMKVTYPNHE